MSNTFKVNLSIYFKLNGIDVINKDASSI